MKRLLVILSCSILIFLSGCGEKESAVKTGSVANSQTNVETTKTTTEPATKPAESSQNNAKSNTGGQMANPMVKIETSMGDIMIELDAKNAPNSTENFLSYVKDGFYEGTIFHRVIPGFMVQGGGMLPDMSEKPTKDSIKNEANNGLKNVRGTLAMARTSEPHSASSQFFINVKDNGFLDFKSESPQGWGYAVFGKVTEGMDIVDKIVAVKTATKGYHGDVPVEPILMNKVSVVE